MERGNNKGRKRNASSDSRRSPSRSPGNRKFVTASDDKRFKPREDARSFGNDKKKFGDSDEKPRSRYGSESRPASSRTGGSYGKGEDGDKKFSPTGRTRAPFGENSEGRFEKREGGRTYGAGKAGGRSYGNRAEGGRSGSGRGYGAKTDGYKKSGEEGENKYAGSRPGRSFGDKKEGGFENRFNKGEGYAKRAPRSGYAAKRNDAEGGEESSPRKSYAPRKDDRKFVAALDRYGKKEDGEGKRSDTRAPRKYASKSDNRFTKGMRKNFDRKKVVTTELEAGDGSMRLNRYVANSGICSRREADDLIVAGLISVNGETITQLGTKVKQGDVVKYNGETIRNEKLKYVLLNKPKDYITTMDDPEDRRTVMNLIADACKERIYPVGRLDRNTTGVLLFTNDGDLAKKLTHPSYEIQKIYHVELDKNLKPADMEKIREGIEMEDGFAKVDDIQYDAGFDDKTQVGVEIHSGKNRIVRRIFESLDYKVIKLDRVIFAGLTKKDVPRGRWRFLTDLEVNMLKMATAKIKSDEAPVKRKRKLAVGKK